MEKKKEKWGKPKLIILTRGKPEERVLAACKADSGGNGPGPAGVACYALELCEGVGAWCSDPGT